MGTLHGYLLNIVGESSLSTKTIMRQLAARNFHRASTERTLDSSIDHIQKQNGEHYHIVQRPHQL